MWNTNDEERLKDLTAETLGVDADDIDDRTSPQTLAEWTSFSHLSLMAAVEEAFGCTFSMEEMTQVASFGDLSRLVQAHLP